MPNEPTLEDYSHWGEDAPMIKAQEDRFADYYAECDPDAFYDEDYLPYD